MKSKSLDYTTLFAVSFAVFLGGAVRFFPVYLSHFPLNDGGLFYTMTQDILDHNFSLPVYTSYNGNEIPFAYPPLPFYLMALIQRFLHIGIIDQLRFLPAFFSTLAIPALYFLSKSVTSSKEKSAFAVFAYALMPHSYLWLIMGGGISRSLGILFGILSVLFVWQMFSNPKLPNLLLSIVCCSLTILSHPEIAWFVLLTSSLIGISYGLNKKGVLYAVLTIIGTLLLTSPWWIVMIQRFGVSLFINGARTGGFINLSIILFYFSGEPFANILAVVALLGLFAEIVRRKFFVPAWLLMISILSARSGQLLATIPGSLLFGSGVVSVLVPGLVSYIRRLSDDSQMLAEIMQERISKLAIGVILTLALFSAMAVPLMGSTETRSLSQYDQQAMQWVSENTSANSQFAILTGEKDWFTDPISEWFPALSERISVSTAQGSEWLPDRQFAMQIESFSQLQSCTEQDYSCILTWAKNNDISFSYLYVIKPKAGETIISLPITHSLVTSDHLQLVFDNPGVSIFNVIDNPPADLGVD